MNRLDIQLNHEPSPVSGISVYADLIVDNIILDYCLDIEVFLRTLKKDGCHPLFTCGCGIFECGGNYVDVELSETEWIIRNQYHPRSKILEKEFEYRFHWESIYMVATKIKDYIAELYRVNPGEIIGCDVSPSSNLAKYLTELHMGFTLHECIDEKTILKNGETGFT